MNRPPTQAGGRKRKGVELRRDEILAATARVVDRLGLAATRVTDVAQELSVSPALVFYHFGTKDDLIVEAFAYAVERDLTRLEQAVARADDPLDRMRRALRSYGPTGPARGWRIWIDAWALAQREPLIRKALRRMDQRWCDTLRSITEDGVAAGIFRCPDVPAAVARASAMLDGLAVATLVYGSISRSELRAWITDAVARELGVAAADLS